MTPTNVLTGLICGALTLPGCASLPPRERLLIGMGTGAAVGAGGGAALSPNSESRGLNALVFGLAGALTGGIAALLTAPKQPQSKAIPSLRDRELGVASEGLSTREFVAPQPTDLPEFVRHRLKPAVIEEYDETDSLTEDGALRAPHKVYRIKRPAELIVRPEVAPGDLRESVQKGSR